MGEIPKWVCVTYPDGEIHLWIYQCLDCGAVFGVEEDKTDTTVSCPHCKSENVDLDFEYT